MATASLVSSLVSLVSSSVPLFLFLSLLSVIPHIAMFFFYHVIPLLLQLLLLGLVLSAVLSLSLPSFRSFFPRFSFSLSSFFPFSSSKPSPSSSPSPSQSQIPSRSPSFTPSPSPVRSRSRLLSPSPAPNHSQNTPSSPTFSPSPSQSRIPSRSPSFTPSPSPVRSRCPSFTPSPASNHSQNTPSSPTFSPSPNRTPFRTFSPSPTFSPPPSCRPHPIPPLSPIRFEVPVFDFIAGKDDNDNHNKDKITEIRKNINGYERKVFEVSLASLRDANIEKTVLSLSEVLMRGLLSLNNISGGEEVKREKEREVVRVEKLLKKIDELKIKLEGKEISNKGKENGKRKREILEEVDELKTKSREENVLRVLNGGEGERERKRVRESPLQQLPKVDPIVEAITKSGDKIQQYEKQVRECTELVLQGRMVEESRFLSLSEILLQEIIVVDGFQGGEEIKRRRRAEIKKAQNAIDVIDDLKTKVDVFEVFLAGDQIHRSNRCWTIQK